MNIEEIVKEAEEKLAGTFKKIDEISFHNTEKILSAFRECRVSEAMLKETTGYGYGDNGRDTLDVIFAKAMNKPAAFVRHNFVNGTHTLATALFSLLRPGDVMLSVTGKPYDTLDEVIGITGDKGNGSLADFGVEYRETAIGEDFLPLLDERVKVVYLQRSRGYMQRKALSVDAINEIYKKVKAHSNAYFVIDNCYGEFTEAKEPDADLLVGSLIKNPGGGMAESGGYIAGTEEAVRLAGYRFTCPGIGLECGASLGQNKNIFKGIFYAPHTTAQALKTACLAAYVFDKLGFDVSPKPTEDRHDIIQTVNFGSPEALCAFCRGIQKGSPVDSYVTPEPWDMPGYSDKIIMAAGGFVQGASIELSADGPIKPPYTAFFQGGLTYESGKLGIIEAARETAALIE